MITKLQITFPANLTNTPLTYRLIKEFDLMVNILKADIDFNNVGHILYEIKGHPTKNNKIKRTIICRNIFFFILKNPFNIICF